MANFSKREVITLLKGGEVSYAKTCTNCVYYEFVAGGHSGVCKHEKFKQTIGFPLSFWETKPQCRWALQRV